MKKVFKALSAILLATACSAPGIAWGAEPSVTLDANGALKAADMGGVHSILVEVTFSGADAAKVTDVELTNAPSDALASAAYAGGKASVAVSAGNEVLQLANSSLGTLKVIAQGASEQNPVSVDARITAVEYLDSDDSTADAKSASVSSSLVTMTSTQGQSSGGTDPDGSGTGSGIDGNGASNGANGANGRYANGATTTADYAANGVVSSTQAGQSANTGLVKTGDVLTICGIALGAAAIAVAVAMLIARKKASARE